MKFKVGDIVKHKTLPVSYLYLVTKYLENVGYRGYHLGKSQYWNRMTCGMNLREEGNIGHADVRSEEVFLQRYLEGNDVCIKCMESIPEEIKQAHNLGIL